MPTPPFPLLPPPSLIFHFHLQPPLYIGFACAFLFLPFSLNFRLPTFLQISKYSPHLIYNESFLRMANYYVAASFGHRHDCGCSGHGHIPHCGGSFPLHSLNCAKKASSAPLHISPLAVYFLLLHLLSSVQNRVKFGLGRTAAAGGQLFAPSSFAIIDSPHPLLLYIFRSSLPCSFLPNAN